MRSSYIKNFDNAQQQTLNSIQSLQNLEKSLYANLENLSANDGSINLQKQIINKINDVSQTRIALLGQLQAMYLNIEDDISSERTELVDQLTLIGVVETELKNNKLRMGSLKDANANNKRMAEINTYYSKKYAAYFKILQLVVYTCIPIIIVNLIGKIFSVPSIATRLLGILFIVIGGYFIIRRVFDLYSRSNMVFDQYNVGSKAPDIPDTTGDIGLDIDVDIPEPECIGSECCGAGLKYDSKNAVCVVSN